MSIDNNAIVNHTCDNISHIYNSVNSAIIESGNDPQVLKYKNLTDHSNSFPSSLVNNVPNSLNTTGGKIAVWNGSTYQLQENTSLGIGLEAGLTFQGGNCVAIRHQVERHNQNTLGIAKGFFSCENTSRHFCCFYRIFSRNSNSRC